MNVMCTCGQICQYSSPCYLIMLPFKSQGWFLRQKYKTFLKLIGKDNSYEVKFVARFVNISAHV